MMNDQEENSPIPFESNDGSPLPVEDDDESTASDDSLSEIQSATAEDAFEPEAELADEAEYADELDQPTALELEPDADADESQEDETLNEIAAAVNFDDLIDTSFDVEAALNALMVADMEAVPVETAPLNERGDDIPQPVAASYAPVNYVPRMALPPATTLKRGSPGSVVPALCLIGLGAWWTITSAAGVPPEPLLVAAAVVASVVITLIAQWLGSGRWGRGFLFFALVIAISAGIILVTIQTQAIDLTRGYPLFVIGIGAAALLSAIIARPVDRRLFAPSLLLIIAGLIGLVVTNGLIPQSMLTAAVAYAPVVAVILVILWVLPVIIRPRN